MDPRPSAPEVVALKARLRDLEAETSGLVRRLRSAPETELSGAHLVLEAAGKLALLGAASVVEVVRVVALQPVPGVATAVAGAFNCRGRSLFALDLGALLESRAARAPGLEAHLVVLGTAAPLALLVDRVVSVVTGVTLVADERRRPAPSPRGPIETKIPFTPSEVEGRARLGAPPDSSLDAARDERGPESSVSAPPGVPERRAQQLSRLVARVGDQVMPLLDAGALSAFVEGAGEAAP